MMFFKKNKKILVIVVTILLCFTMFQKPKKTEAFDFVITPTVLWALGALVTASGVVAVNHEQVVDMGKKVWDRLEYREGNMVYDVVNGVKTLIGIKADKSVIDAVSGVAQTLPNTKTNTYDISDIYSSSRQNIALNGNILNFSNVMPGSIPLVNNVNDSLAKTLISSNTLFTVHRTADAGSRDALISKYDMKDGYVYNFGDMKVHHFGLLNHNGIVYLYVANANSEFTQFGLRLIKAINSESDMFVTFNNSRYIDSSKSYFYKEIDYSLPQIKAGYNEGLVTQELPYSDENKGVITIPQTVPVDVPISTGNPLTWDKAKDVVIPNVGTIPDTGTIEDEITFPGGSDEIELPNDLSLWGWLKALLGLFLKGLQAIFDVIKSVLNFIKGFLANLIEAFKTLLSALFAPIIQAINAVAEMTALAFSTAIEYLFTPTLKVTDLFIPLSDTGFGQIDEIVDFSSMFEVGQKPFVFSEVLKFDLITQKVEYPLKIDFSEFKFLNENINLVRNLLSFPLLLGSIWFVLRGLLPQRVVD